MEDISCALELAERKLGKLQIHTGKSRRKKLNLAHSGPRQDPFDRK